MPDPLLAGRTLSLSAAERHDRLCDRFEDIWRAGAAPRIEDLLPEVPADERPALFVALLRVELERRAEAAGAAAEYRARFPAFADLVDTVFRDPAATPPAAPGPDSIPTPPRIAGYEVTGILGHGGMGVVYHGRHRELGRPVAIKMVRAGAHCPPGHLLRFHLEAQAVAGLSHPSVVTVHDFGQADGLPYLVMELVEGGSLADRLAGAPADPVWAAGLVERLARAVQYVHDRDLVHRDLKPANILLAPDGTPKVTDFGLVKRLAGDGDLTRTWSVLGTACYMCPEQARGETKTVGPAADVYGLGAILYECLTGRPPFRAASYELTVVQVLNEDPARPADLVPGLPADLEAVCLKCLEKDPIQRYARAADLADDLARYREGQPVQARPLHVLDRHAKWARRIGYELGELGGATRWAFNYRATHAAIGRPVRLVLSVGAVGTPSHAALKRQAEALAGLDHPNVIRLHDYGEQFGQPYLVLEHVEGGESLARRLRAAMADDPPPDGPGSGEVVTDLTHLPMAPKEAAHLALMLSLGLQGVHEHGFLHGGLQPSEVVLARDGTPKLANFLAARRRNRPADGPDPAWVLPHYQPPEVLDRSWDAVGPWSDLYALGAMLFDM
ncbi:MAG TPA: protein kinase, partial [Gemmataceae bacterium]|nr:protein kinase [Gemmataceae bacterium]